MSWRSPAGYEHNLLLPLPSTSSARADARNPRNREEASDLRPQASGSVASLLKPEARGLKPDLKLPVSPLKDLRPRRGGPTTLNQRHDPARKKSARCAKTFEHSSSGQALGKEGNRGCLPPPYGTVDFLGNHSAVGAQHRRRGMNSPAESLKSPLKGTPNTAFAVGFSRLGSTEPGNSFPGDRAGALATSLSAPSQGGGQGEVDAARRESPTQEHP